MLLPVSNELQGHVEYLPTILTCLLPSVFTLPIQSLTATQTHVAQATHSSIMSYLHSSFFGIGIYSIHSHTIQVVNQQPAMPQPNQTQPNHNHKEKKSERKGDIFNRNRYITS